MRYIILLLWLVLGMVYFLLAKNYCVPSQVETGIATNSSQVVKVPCPAVEPFYFDWSSEKIVSSEEWSLYIEDMLKNMTETSKIRITGLYVNKEINNTSFGNLGLARANALAQLIGLDEDKYQIAHDSIRDYNFGIDCKLAGAQLRLVTVSEKIKEIAANPTSEDDSDSSYDRTLIYFPVNSINKLSDDEVETYLDALALKVIKSGGRIEIYGHTDNSGNAEYNLQLGERRASIIKQYLLNQNVDSDMIETKSFGDSKPIATNDTEEGRAENRRAELRIIND